MNAIRDRMNLAWRTVNAILGRIHAMRDRMNLAWETVNAIHGRIHAICARPTSPYVSNLSCGPATIE